MIRSIGMATLATALSLTASLSTVQVASFLDKTENYELAQTQTKKNRDGRQDDRQGDRDDRQDTREDCREAEGAGKDKRDCKQDGRQDGNNASSDG